MPLKPPAILGAIIAHARFGSAAESCESSMLAVARLRGGAYRCESAMQARGLLPRAVELGRDRSHALGPPACRWLLDRADRLRCQSRRRSAVRGQGERERAARLSPHLDRKKG